MVQMMRGLADAYRRCFRSEVFVVRRKICEYCDDESLADYRFGRCKNDQLDWRNLVGRRKYGADKDC